ncbi:hypothetical protein EV356DRAFT_342688 [Viridothelium virens]|uniref:Uncharacterized protein n=1 Tax=Viridothelium virens TaxID=1048519 RepID=A0A6A6GXD8_VIRVR|nr:hypothetical protein EV356DRAFT_342688 [Viridothelium virens]
MTSKKSHNKCLTFPNACIPRAWASCELHQARASMPGPSNPGTKMAAPPLETVLLQGAGQTVFSPPSASTSCSCRDSFN